MKLGEENSLLIEHIKYKMAIAHHVMLTVEYASGVQKGSLNWRLQFCFHKNMGNICGYEGGHHLGKGTRGYMPERGAGEV